MSTEKAIEETEITEDQLKEAVVNDPELEGMIQGFPASDKNEAYPDMTVEFRESETAHGLRPPIPPGTSNFEEQLQDTIQLASCSWEDHWCPTVVKILEKYSPVCLDIEEENRDDYMLASCSSKKCMRAKPLMDNKIHIPFLMSYFGVKEGWKEVCDFVRDDECIEFAVLVAKFCKAQGFKVRKDRDFIDGEGVGFYRRYTERLERCMEKCFDAKYFFAEERPLEVLYAKTGVDFSTIADYIHPGHNRYPAGHGTKFYEAVDLAYDTWDMSEAFRDLLIIIAFVYSMGRSGILVHLPEDNIVAGALSGLPHFEEWRA